MKKHQLVGSFFFFWGECCFSLEKQLMQLQMFKIIIQKALAAAWSPWKPSRSIDLKTCRGIVPQEIRRMMVKLGSQLEGKTPDPEIVTGWGSARQPNHGVPLMQNENASKGNEHIQSPAGTFFPSRVGCMRKPWRVSFKQILREQQKRECRVDHVEAMISRTNSWTGMNLRN